MFKDLGGWGFRMWGFGVLGSYGLGCQSVRLLRLRVLGLGCVTMCVCVCAKQRRLAQCECSKNVFRFYGGVH